MKKSNWTVAINTAKKAKDKSIYNFIRWRQLLTKGNKTSFYEYMNFIREINKRYGVLKQEEINQYIEKTRSRLSFNDGTFSFDSLGQTSAILPEVFINQSDAFVI